MIQKLIQELIAQGMPENQAIIEANQIDKAYLLGLDIKVVASEIIAENNELEEALELIPKPVIAQSV
jgi:uncharacterized protein YoaH (UPF0181 family)